MIAVPTSPPPDLTVIRRALISVSDKSGLENLGAALQAAGVEILSTGGSAKALAAAGIAVTEVADVTGFPEIMDGRVKTLHPKIHGGILARRDTAAHLEAMEAHGIGPIDLVVINLYPFEATRDSGADFATCVENIDIGGPAMVRAAAKNQDFVTVVTDPGSYAALIAELDAQDGATSLALRRRLAAEAFAHTARYDALIADYLGAQRADTQAMRFPDDLIIPARRDMNLRYGENPHQEAAFYRWGPPRAGVAGARQVQGKALSYNNLNDTDAAFELIADLHHLNPEKAAVAIIKHANPCGVAQAETLEEAYAKALACDPVSAFGGIIATNRELDGRAAARMIEIFSEVIIAPAVSPEAAAEIARKKNLRLLVTGGLPDAEAPGWLVRTLSGGLLVQDRDSGLTGAANLRTVTKRSPSAAEVADLLFAFRVAKHVKSNAIVFARGGATLGVGAGQMSRVDSARIAHWKAKEAAAKAGIAESQATAGCVVASDAFFPLADGLQAAIAAGATAVIQPGGSMRDDEVIAAADQAGLAMVFTGKRHFRH
jgi:phosphoribosylaminoimidazolecarboxamide formyltransferase/IMP cyclohydrolase